MRALMNRAFGMPSTFAEDQGSDIYIAFIAVSAFNAWYFDLTSKSMMVKNY
jgi:hypothetical protein